MEGPMDTSMEEEQNTQETKDTDSLVLPTRPKIDHLKKTIPMCRAIMASANPKEVSSSAVQANVLPATSVPSKSTHPFNLFSAYKLQGGFGVDSGWLTNEQFNEAVAGKRPNEPYQESVLRYETEREIPFSKVALSKAELATLQAASMGKVENIKDMFSKFFSDHVVFLRVKEKDDIVTIAEELKSKELTREQLANIGQRVVEGFSAYEDRLWEAAERSADNRVWAEENKELEGKQYFQAFVESSGDIFEDTRCITRDLDIIRAWIKFEEA